MQECSLLMVGSIEVAGGPFHDAVRQVKDFMGDSGCVNGVGRKKHCKLVSSTVRAESIPILV